MSIFTVVEVSGAAKVGEQTTHKVKLVLEPVQPVAPRQPGTGPAARLPGHDDAPPALAGGVVAVSQMSIETSGADHAQRWEPVILQLPAAVEAWAQKVSPGEVGRVLGSTLAGATGAAALDFDTTGRALNTMFQEAARNPHDPRYQVFTSLLVESSAKQDAARTDRGFEASA